ncbi:hypothetical protein EWB00_010086 [Schistosoma japonicum]|uniref:Uncharacterized protein n=1 Tax=Schistosoma japonicum TaxID=6182 RepID=A0A4Z2DQ34_SCHJA|nr:hypothetical protein EWB00_010086 [Schistosoma japonicum]
MFFNNLVSLQMMKMSAKLSSIRLWSIEYHLCFFSLMVLVNQLTSLSIDAFSMYQNDKVYQPSIDKIFTNIKEIEQNDSWSKYTKINEPNELVIAPVKYDRSRRYAKLHKKALRRQRRAIKLQKRLYRRHYRAGYKYRPYRS